jgi:ABC-type transport system involved in cytochrome c biogenesis permease component
MLFSAIIERELRLSARDWRTYYSRVLVGLWALGLCLYLIFLMRTAFGGAAAGAQALVACTTLALALCLFNGASRTCDCLSSEKREGTLGFLFLTHLKARDIVLGKLFAHGLRTVYLLIAITPVLAIPIFVGGVSGVELLRVPVLLLNSLLLSLSIGMLVSSLSITQRTAQGVAGLIIATLAFFLPAAGYLVDRYAQMPRLAQGLNLLSPAYALQMSAGSAFGLSTNLFWSALAVQCVTAMAALSAGCWLLPHFWKIKASRGWRFKEWLARVAHGGSETRRRRRSRMLSRNAIYWLNNRDRLAMLWPTLFAIGSFGVTGSLLWYFEARRETVFASLFATLALNDFFMRIRVAQIASVQLGNDRQSGALEMILSTPLAVRDIVRGIWAAVRQRLLWTYAALLITYGVLVVLYMGPVSWRWLPAAFFLVFSVADFIAMGYVAIWDAMRMRHPQGATGHALLRVLVLPWSIWSVLMPFAVQFPFEFGGLIGLFSGVFIWAISTATAIRSAQRKIFTHFREAATDRYNFEQRTSLLSSARRWSDSFLTLILLRSRRPGMLS